MTTFHDFGLAEPIERALVDAQYDTPTPVQAKAIPIVLTGGDLIGIAQTGTGKTAAFALPILNRLAADRRRAEPKSCRVLVLSPTRELSAQILDSFRTYGKHLGITSDLVIGGVPQGRQIKALARGLDVLVATPGRLLDLMRMNTLRLDRVEVLVLDEADRMLDMGFIRDIRAIVAKVPAKRQTLMFSATMPKEIADLADQMLRNPATVSVTPQAATVDLIEQRVIFAERAAKPGLLAEVLKAEPLDRALVFTRTKHGADKVVRGLARDGLTAEAIHGNKSQGQRERVLGAFRDGRVRILVATDIAARGIDVTGISHVINYDVPNIAETYVHRIGRTGRAGAAGVAISLCDGEEQAYLRGIEKLIRKEIPSPDGPRPKSAAPSPGKRESGAPGRGKSARRSQQPRHGGGGSGGGGGKSGRTQPSGQFADMAFLNQRLPTA